MTAGPSVALPTEWRLFAEIDHELLHHQVRRRVTPALVAEHRRSPHGPHSADLLFVLTVLRRFAASLERKLVIVEHPDGFGIARLTGRRGEGVVDVDPRRFPTRADAEHAVFLTRLDDLGVAP